MPATVKCKKENREEIKKFLIEKIGASTELLHDDDYELYAEDTEDGIIIIFPVGEIYGYTSDFVEIVAQIFKNLKEQYPDIAIHGYAYEYETVTAITYGPLFYCSENDEELTIKYEWQECFVCHNIEADTTFYNSSQWDFGEGTNQCLCCPTCMLVYSLTSDWDEVEPNASFTEEECDDIFDNEEFDQLVACFIDKLSKNIDEYMDDFRKHKEIIVELSKNKEIEESHRPILDEILKKM